MFGFNHKDSVEDMECEFGFDPVDQEMTDLTHVSKKRHQRAPQCADLSKSFKRNRRVHLIRHFRTISKRSTDAQDETSDMECESSSLPQQAEHASPSKQATRPELPQQTEHAEKTKTAKRARQPDDTGLAKMAKMDLQPEQTEQPESTKMEGQPIRAKPRRGGVIHRHENHCCPFLPSSRRLPQSHYELLVEDFRDMGQTFSPRSFWI